MRLRTLPATLALTHLLTSTLATPLPTTAPPSLLPRSEFCTNAPTTKVGTLLDRSWPQRLQGRKSTSTILWCAPGSKTYIILSIGKRIPSAFISGMLSTVINVIDIHVQRLGDAVLGVYPTSPATVFRCASPSPLSPSHKTVIRGGAQYLGRAGQGGAKRSEALTGSGVGTGNGELGLSLNVANANNHQTTWGVLGAALAALEDYMQSQDTWGTAEFTIFDGTNEVGKGTLG